MTKTEGDRICHMVLRLTRAVHAELRRDDVAPSDFFPQTLDNGGCPQVVAAEVKA